MNEDKCNLNYAPEFTLDRDVTIYLSLGGLGVVFLHVVTCHHDQTCLRVLKSGV